MLLLLGLLGSYSSSPYCSHKFTALSTLAQLLPLPAQNGQYISHSLLHSVWPLQNRCIMQPANPGSTFCKPYL